jgi:hypothetical protein
MFEFRRHCEERELRSNPAFTVCRVMDCFAEPVIGPRSARTRWLAMTLVQRGLLFDS